MPRTELVWFSEQQEKKLKLHDDRGHWSNESYHYLMARLREEVTELEHALALLRHGDSAAVARLIEECADVGNFAMMIADNARAELE